MSTEVIEPGKVTMIATIVVIEGDIYPESNDPTRDVESKEITVTDDPKIVELNLLVKSTQSAGWMAYLYGAARIRIDGKADIVIRCAREAT